MSLPSDDLDPRALARLQRALSELPREQAPNALERRLRVVDCLVRSERPVAPAELDERVALELSTRASIASSLRGLEPQGAPAVLERLVAEEIAQPSKVLAERFLGDLPRVPIPSVAETGRVLPGRWARARWMRTAAGLAAAVLGVLMIGPLVRERGGDGPRTPDRPPLRFGRTAASANDLDPVALALIDGLSGGATLEQRKQGDAR